jgi:hypothetical protein
LITEKDEDIFDQELIGILGDLYDEIDAAFADAYGWPVDLSDEDILLRLVALNKERAVQETLGHIRWLRLDYQNPTGQQTGQGVGVFIPPTVDLLFVSGRGLETRLCVG